MPDTYEYDAEYKKARAQANAELKQTRTWQQLLDLFDWTYEYGMTLHSKRRKGIELYHFLLADVRRNNRPLVMYLVGDGVHAGSSAISNLFRHFTFKVGSGTVTRPPVYRGDK